MHQEGLLPPMHEALDFPFSAQAGSCNMRQCAHRVDADWTDADALSFSFAPVAIYHRSKDARILLAFGRDRHNLSFVYGRTVVQFSSWQSASRATGELSFTTVVRI